MDTRSAPALVLIDVQRGFDDPDWGPRNNPAAEQQIAQLLDAWRASDAPIVHVRHRSTRGGLFLPGSTAFEFKPEGQPRASEPIVEKTVNSAFIGTDLEAGLRNGGTRVVALAGFTTDHCCSTTARMAANLGFDTWFVEDAMATFDRRSPDGETFPAALMHRAELASLHGEFCDVLRTAEAVARLASSPPER